MKRSEMIKIISDFIYELNVEPDECDSKSSTLLKKLEEFGMLPPGYLPNDGDTVMDIDDLELIDGYFTWEPEDSEKL